MQCFFWPVIYQAPTGQWTALLLQFNPLGCVCSAVNDIDVISITAADDCVVGWMRLGGKET